MRLVGECFAPSLAGQKQQRQRGQQVNDKVQYFAPSLANYALERTPYNCGPTWNRPTGLLGPSQKLKSYTHEMIFFCSKIAVFKKCPDRSKSVIYDQEITCSVHYSDFKLNWLILRVFHKVSKKVKIFLKKNKFLGRTNKFRN